MTLDLTAIFVFVVAAFVYAGLLPARWRGWALLVGSVVAIYWLQPALPIRFSDYILPTATIGLAVGGWWLTRPGEERSGERGAGSEEREERSEKRGGREDWWTVGVVVGVVVGMAFMRYVEAEYRLTASRPPAPLWVGLVLVVMGGGAAGLSWLRRCRGGSRTAPTAGMAVIVGLFVLLKTEVGATVISGWWRGWMGQDVALAGPADLNWLGFSYVAFRLIHTLRDRQTGLLPALSLREYLTYVIFFPAYTAGPIDRVERFAADLRALPAMVGLDAGRFAEGGSRIVIGLFKKFVVADGLAQGVSLTAANAGQVESTAGLWLLLYGYALRLFFDFSGYSDIAIGLGILFGVRLPENFDRPYLRTNLTAFWQSWHMTLSSWARFYVFTPLSRWLLRRPKRPSSVVIVLLCQLATMVVIGLWHGLTVNFLIWGVWHGLGLFVHKQWSDRTRGWYRRLGERPGWKRVWTFFAWFLTFHYVVLGWVWFVVPETGQAVRLLGRLFGG